MGGIQVFIMDSELTTSISVIMVMDCYYTIPAVLGWRISSSDCPSDGSSSPSCRSKHSSCAEINNPSDVYNSHGHNCLCSDGYQGNPYISDGCYGNPLIKIILCILYSSSTLTINTFVLASSTTSYIQNIAYILSCTVV